MTLIRYITLVFLSLAINYASAQCSFDSNLFEGKLVVAETDGTGLPIILATPEEELSELFINCEAGSKATLSISPPIRMKDGGPVLNGKRSSFFIYQNRRYSNKETIIVTGEFRNRSVKVGMMIGDERYPLPAAANYKYAVTMTLVSGTTTDQ